MKIPQHQINAPRFLMTASLQKIRNCKKQDNIPVRTGIVNGHRCQRDE
jgi:hypothetical protein